MKTYKINICGAFDVDHLFDFCRHRALRLDLPGTFSPKSTTEVQILVRGEEALVDMFEVACWLGPRTALVDEITTKEYRHQNAKLEGFRRV